MQRLLEKLSLAIFVASSLATFLAALMPEVAQEAVVLGCAAAWAAAAVVIAVPYCARFKASLADHVWVAGALAGLLVLPLLPFLLWERPASHPFFFLTLILGPLIGSGARRAFRAQGRYFGSDRELPELTGEPRRHAEAVLERAGLRAASFRVESLGSFNAAVQGLRRCIVMVDRRAAESLPPAELAAMVAHEAGHVRYGGMLPYFAVAPVALAAASFAAPLWAEGDRLAPLLLYLPGLIVLQTAVRQLLEIACDRRAARWTSPGDVGRLLVKLHADQPALVQRVTQGWLAVPFVSHPPLRVRLAAFGEGAARDLVRYRSIWTFVVLCFFVAPFALLAAGAAAGVSLPEPFRAAAVALPVAFAVLHGLFWTRVALVARKLHQPLLAGTSLWRSNLLGMVRLSGVTLAALLAAREYGSVESPALGAAAVTCAAAFALFLLLALATGALRPEHRKLPRRLRKVVVGASAALEEGRPAEALSLVDSSPPRHRSHPWIASTRGACLVYLGRLDEAARELGAFAASRGAPPPARWNLLVAELLRGNIARAEELASACSDAAPDAPEPWYLGGLVALEAGRLEEADARFERAAERSGGRRAGALAGRALCALEAREPRPEPAGWLAEAESMEPQSPMVLLAGARLRHRRGDIEEARRLFDRAIAKLRERGLLGWVPYYERRARAWGLDKSE